MEIKENIFESVLNENGTKKSLTDVISEGTISLLEQIKVLSDGVRLSIHSVKALGLTENEVKKLEAIASSLTEAKFAVLKAYKQSSTLKKTPDKPITLNACTQPDDVIL